MYFYIVFVIGVIAVTTSESAWRTRRVSKSEMDANEKLFVYEGWAMTVAKFNGRDEEVAVSLPNANMLAGKVYSIIL